MSTTAEMPTVPMPAVSTKVTRKLPRVQFVRPQPLTPPHLVNVLDVRLHVDAVQRTLLTRLFRQGGSVAGTLDQLHSQLAMPVTRGDLYALYEQGLISLGYNEDVWTAEVKR